jgi:hypothetical protein
MKRRPPKELVKPDPQTGETIAALKPPEPLTATVKFSWSEGVDIDEFWLEVGTTPGGKDLYDSTEELELSTTVPAIPLDVPIYVRLWSRMEGRWFAYDYKFIFRTTVDADGRTSTEAGTIIGPSTQVTFT